MDKAKCSKNCSCEKCKSDNKADCKKEDCCNIKQEKPCDC